MKCKQQQKEFDNEATGAPMNNHTYCYSQRAEVSRQTKFHQGVTLLVAFTCILNT